MNLILIALFGIVAFTLGCVVGRLRIKSVLIEIENGLNSMNRGIQIIRVQTASVVRRDEATLTYYGPHPCQVCDVDGKKGTLIVKAGNGAPDYLEFDFPRDEADKQFQGNFPDHWLYPNTSRGTLLTWNPHKHIKVKKTKKNKSK